MGFGRYIRELYDNEEAPAVATGMLSVGIALLFAGGLFMIFNAHNSSHSQQLSQAMAAVRKSQIEGISLSQALAELKTASAVTQSPKLSTAPVDAAFATLTVNGTSALQGDVNAQKGVSVAGRLAAKGGLDVTGAISVNGKSLERAYIQNSSDDPQNGTAIRVDDIKTATLTVSGLASVGALQINGHIIGNDDTRGTVTVKAGQTAVHHSFNTAYDQAPVVVASPSNHATLFNITPTATGFDITMPAAAIDDTTFNYLVEQ